MISLHEEAGSFDAWNRKKIETRLDEMLRQSAPFCVLLIGVRNLPRIEQRYSQNVVEGMLRALLKRFHEIAGSAAIGRWSEQQFIAILDEPGGAIALTSEAAHKLSGAYSIQENGFVQEVQAEVTAGVVERAPGAQAARFHKKLDQLAAALLGA